MIMNGLFFLREERVLSLHDHRIMSGVAILLNFVHRPQNVLAQL